MTFHCVDRAHFVYLFISSAFQVYVMNIPVIRFCISKPWHPVVRGQGILPLFGQDCCVSTTPLEDAGPVPSVKRKAVEAG